MRLAMFADSKFTTDGAGRYYSSANLRRAMLHALADQCRRLTVVCRLNEGSLDHLPAEDLIHHPNIEFLGIPFFRGIVGSYLV